MKPDYSIRYIPPARPVPKGEIIYPPFDLPCQSFNGEMKWASIEELQAQGVDIREATPEEIRNLLR